VSKLVILNGKIEFFIKIHLIATKNDQKWSKIDTHLEYKNRSQFDYQKGDSGSALMLGEKCVMTEAPKIDTIIDQKWCQQQKSDKKWQKSTKHKKW